MNAGPFPTKAMFEETKKRTQDLGYEENLGGGNKYYVPTFQLGSGSAISVRCDGGQEPQRTPKPVKVLELSWENVQLLFDGAGINTMPGEPLTADDIDTLDLLPLSPAHPTPAVFQSLFPRAAWGLLITDADTYKPEDAWTERFQKNSGSAGGSNLFMGSDFPATMLASGIIRLTFTGDGTMKLRNDGGTRIASHPGVKLVARDKDGEIVDAGISMGTFSRQAGRTIGFLNPGSMPIAPAPTDVHARQDWTGRGGYTTGMEIVWPPDGGTPYLHLFREGSTQNGTGVDYHIPFLPGLPQPQ